MELLRELAPGAKRVALLINPTDRSNESTLRDVETAAIGQQVLAFEAAPVIDRIGLPPSDTRSPRSGHRRNRPQRALAAGTRPYSRPFAGGGSVAMASNAKCSG
jgi:hypothetical protein